MVNSIFYYSNFLIDLFVLARREVGGREEGANLSVK